MRTLHHVTFSIALWLGFVGAAQAQIGRGQVTPERSLEGLRSKVVKVTGFVIPVDGGPIPASTEVVLIDQKDGDTTRVRPLAKNGAFGLTADACRDYLIECHVDGKAHWRDKFTAMCSSFQSTEINIDLYRNITLGAPSPDRPANPVLAATDDNDPPPMIGYDLLVNTADFDESAPVLNADKTFMYFSSDRPLPGESARGERSYRLFYVRYRNNAWEPAAPLWPFGEKERMRICSFVPGSDGAVVAFKGVLYEYRLNGIEFSRRSELPAPINSPHRETHGIHTPDGRAFYFSSDRPGGFGGLDLYVCHRNADGSWGTPMNLGYHVNSSGDEDGAAFTPGGDTLWFCSTGHAGTGGSDVFRCAVRDGHRAWEVAYDVDATINTEANETDVSISADGKWVYWATDRRSQGSLSDPRGQWFRKLAHTHADARTRSHGPAAWDDAFAPEESVVPTSDIRNANTSAVGDRPGAVVRSPAGVLDDSEVWLIDNNTGRRYNATVDRATGRIQSHLPPGSYQVQAWRNGTQTCSGAVTVPEGRPGSTAPIDIAFDLVAYPDRRQEDVRPTPIHVVDGTGHVGPTPDRREPRQGDHVVPTHDRRSADRDPDTDGAGGDGTGTANATTDGAMSFVDLRQGDVAFYCPDTLDLGIEYMVYARMRRSIDRDSAMIVTALRMEVTSQRSDLGLDAPDAADLKYNTVQLKDRMLVELTGPAEVFDIQADRANALVAVRSDEFTDWIWRVKVRPGATAGEQHLAFKVYGQDLDEPTPKLRLARNYKVFVVMERWHFFSSLWGAVKADPVSGSTTMLLPLLAFFAGMLVRRKRRKEAAKERAAA